ncbi:hypothetical protein HLB30_02725 [Peptostreptococcus russellii]|uniref:hypothetical protein n=1 Tax=Peptostreptococcus russellii TaxID=215200 RepID=UPI001623851F|nr:hypothetical protein [Peptostreptococcus russellii]MBC2577431.1 hypothetical protein [Peptostreptococcus russellii]
MLKSSKKGAFILISLILSLILVSTIFKHFTKEKFTVESLSGDQKYFDDINLIYSNNLEYLQGLINSKTPENKNIRIKNSILISGKKNSDLNNISIEDNKFVFSSKDKDKYKYNVNYYNVSVFNDVYKSYILYNDTLKGERRKLLIKDNGLLNKFKDYNYQDYSLLEYKGEKYIIGYFMDDNMQENPPSKLTLEMLSLKLSKKGNSYSEFGSKSFTINNVSKKEEDGKSYSVEKYSKAFQIDGKSFLAFKIGDTIDVYSYSPEENTFEKVRNVEKDLFPALEYDDSFFVNYENKLYYIYLKGNIQYIREIEYKNNSLSSSVTSETGIKRSSADSKLSEMNFDKNGNKVSKDKNYDYGFWLQSPASRFFVKDNKVIFIAENSLMISNPRSYNMNPIFKVSILDLDKKKEIYRGIIRANFNANVSAMYISDKISK